MHKTPNLNKKIALLTGDVLLILISTYLTVAIRFFVPLNVLDYYTGATLFILASYILSFYIFDLYNLNYNFRSTIYLTQHLIAIITGAVIVVMAFYILPHWKFGRGIVIINAGLIVLFTYSWRLVFQRFFVRTRSPQKMVIVGAGYAARKIYDVLKENGRFNINGFLDDDQKKIGEQIGLHKVLGETTCLNEMIKKGKIDSIVVAITHEKRPELISALLDAKLRGITIYDMPTLYEELTGKLPVAYLREGWLVYTPLLGIRKSVYMQHAKRLVDICISSLGLLISLPILAIAAIAIKFDSKGPIFFKQKRVGLEEEVFEVIKLRSMRIDAESDGAVWAIENDPRVTRIGRFLRKMRIDETPQLWNVLKGDMSLVGPRPERPEFVESLKKEIPFYSIRHAVKPGVTGWAQVNYKYGASTGDAIEKLQFDVYYIKNLTFFLDLHIVLKTFRVLLFRIGAR